MALGGSPKNSTLEVAIYQYALFELNFNKAIILSIIQIVICLFFICGSWQSYAFLTFCMVPDAVFVVVANWWWEYFSFLEQELGLPSSSD